LSLKTEGNNVSDKEQSVDLDSLVSKDYELGFTVDVESDTIEPGLSEDTIRFLSEKKDEPAWMTNIRLQAFHMWEKMEEPHEWAHFDYPPIDYQAISYYSAPKKPLGSLDEVDPEPTRGAVPRSARSSPPHSVCRQERHPQVVGGLRRL